MMMATGKEIRLGWLFGDGGKAVGTPAVQGVPGPNGVPSPV